MIVQQTYTIPLKRKPSFDETPVVNFASFSSQPPVIYSIEHATSYRYSAPIHHSKHLFRLQPVQDQLQTVLDYRFSLSAKAANVANFSGVFGNIASFVEIQEHYHNLTILSQSIVAISTIPKNLELMHQPRTMPLIWMPWDRQMMAAYLQPPELAESELFELAGFAMSFVEKNHHDVFAVLEEINRTIYKEFTYQVGSTTLCTTPYEVYKQKKGICQDFANLFICLARLLDIPARYRVGYLYTGETYGNKEQGDATHAWAEVFLPYVGWVGFDPTNGCLAEENHIRVACGRYYKDATPTSGAIFSAENEVKEELFTSVKVHRLDLQ
jgi:transglutaminase-like putative cysteine protease